MRLYNRFGMAAWTNKLYFGDNLDILRENVADESVDLIYLDPALQLERHLQCPVSSAERRGFRGSDNRVRGHLEVEHRIGIRLPGRDNGRAGKAGRPAPINARFSRSERHDGVPDHDGAANGRTASRP